jgi:Flp pilus assembly protein TadG
MTTSKGRVPRHSRDESGATLVEFALVAPVVFLLLFGIIGGCFLAYQNSALHNGVTAGSRMASIETSLVTPGQTPSTTGFTCESDQPSPIEQTVAQASPLLKVNTTQLCDYTNSATELTQNAPVNGEVNLTVICAPSCAAPQTVTVQAALSTKGLVAPIGLTYHLTATSTDPGPSVVP